MRFASTASPDSSVLCTAGSQDEAKPVPHPPSPRDAPGTVFNKSAGLYQQKLVSIGLTTAPAVCLGFNKHSIALYDGVIVSSDTLDKVEVHVVAALASLSSGGLGRSVSSRNYLGYIDSCARLGIDPRTEPPRLCQ